MPAHLRDRDGYEIVGEGTQRVDVSDTDGLYRALDEAVPGTRIVLADGVYRGDADGFVIRDQAGTRQRGLTIEAARPGGAVFQGTSSFLVQDCAHVVLRGLRHEGTATDRDHRKRAFTIADSHHVRITRCSMAMDNSPGASVLDNDYVFVEGDSERNRIDHCRFGPKSTIGAFVYLRMNTAGTQVCRLTTIDHNHFDQLSGAPDSNYEPVRLGHGRAQDSSALTLFEHNLMTDCVADNEFVSVKSSDNVIRHNTFRGMFGALVLRNGDRNDVYGNLWFGEGREESGGITVNDGHGNRVWNNHLSGLTAEASNRPGGILFEVVETAGDRVTDCVFVHNSIIDCVRPVLLGRQRDASYRFQPVGTTVANNLIVASSSYPLIEEGGAERTAFDGNVLSQSGRGGTGRESNTPRGRLLLEPTDVGLMIPGSESPVSGGAVGRWPLIDEDVQGRARPDAAAVGAVEASGRPTRTPLTPADVGPASG